MHPSTDKITDGTVVHLQGSSVPFGGGPARDSGLRIRVDEPGSVVQLMGASPVASPLVLAPITTSTTPLLSSSAPPIATLIEDYAAYLKVKKGRSRSTGHIRQVSGRVTRMLEGLSRLEDLTPEHVEARMHELLLEPVGGPRGRSGEPRTKSRTTVNGFRRDLGTFVKWLQRKRKLVRENVVDQVDSFDGEDPREPARAFSPTELAAFFAAVPATASRALVYLFWLTTGIRPLETRRVTWGDVVLDHEHPHVLLRCSTSKNHKRERQPLHPQIAELLRAARPKKAKETDSVFAELPNCETFNKDIGKAGLTESRETPEGKLTRYSLRKTFITMIVSDERNAGIAHKIARHSNSELTFGTYTSFDLKQKANVVASLVLPGGEPSKEAGGPLQSVALPLGYAAEQHSGEDSDVGVFAGDRARILAQNPVRVNGDRASREVAALEKDSGVWTRQESVAAQSAQATTVRRLTSMGMREVRVHRIETPPVDLERLARELLAVAAIAPDPAPLVEAAQVLWSLKKPEPAVAPAGSESVVLSDKAHTTGPNEPDGRTYAH